MKQTRTFPRKLEGVALLRDRDFLRRFKAKLDEIGAELARKRKDTRITIRLNRYDVEELKRMAAGAGVGYQTLISEILHELVKGRMKGRSSHLNIKHAK
ncbi:MAG: hypothetical protein HY585_00280 [Candidatus Omnitrophica bacterium]|nr:hypothetical protein [Candidatus Omnitrophota bacterium]